MRSCCDLLRHLAARQRAQRLRHLIGEAARGADSSALHQREQRPQATLQRAPSTQARKRWSHHAAEAAIQQIADPELDARMQRSVTAP